MIDPQFHAPDHLNYSYLGAWYAPEIMTADDVIANIANEPRTTVFFRANELYERAYGNKHGNTDRKPIR